MVEEEVEAEALDLLTLNGVSKPGFAYNVIGLRGGG